MNIDESRFCQLYAELVETVFTSRRRLFEITAIMRIHLRTVHKLKNDGEGWEGAIAYWVGYEDQPSSEALIAHSEESKLWEPLSGSDFSLKRWTDEALMEYILERSTNTLIIPLFTAEHLAAVQGRKKEEVLQ